MMAIRFADKFNRLEIRSFFYARKKNNESDKIGFVAVDRSPLMVVGCVDGMQSNIFWKMTANQFPFR